MRIIKTKTIALLGLCAVPLIMCLPDRSSATSTAKPKTYEVKISNFTFQPKRVTIKVGDKVRWTDQDDFVVHDVDSDDETSFASSDLEKGDKFQHRFRKKGRFPYHCSFHGGVGGQGMSGVIVVK